jgi:hypothetical protein
MTTIQSWEVLRVVHFVSCFHLGVVATQVFLNQSRKAFQSTAWVFCLFFKKNIYIYFIIWLRWRHLLLHHFLPISATAD